MEPRTKRVSRAPILWAARALASTAALLPAQAQGSCQDGQSRFLYWVGSVQGSMERIDLVTGDEEFLYDGTFLVGIDVDGPAKKVWWIDRLDSSTQPATRLEEGNHVVSVHQTVASGQYMTDVAVDPVGDRYYLTRTSGGTRSYVLSTGAQEHIFANQNSVAVTLDLAGGRVYWAENESAGAFDHTHSARLDNTDVQHLFTVTNTNGLAVDSANGKLYAAVQGAGLNPGPLVRSNLDGSQLEPVFVTGVSGDAAKGLDVVVDAEAGKLYWSNQANEILSIDLPTTLPIPYPLATLVKDVSPDRPSSLSLSCADLCAFTFPTSETVRVGTPPNPAAFQPGQTSGPVIGATWDPVIDHATFVSDSIADFALITGGPLNLPLGPEGTLLCDVTTPLLVFAPSAAPGAPFTLPVPDNCPLVGVTICAQGVSIDSGGATHLANALDVTIGTF